MTLNIRDPEAHRLASAISETTGQSMTRVVTDALRERYAGLRRNRRKATAEELLLIAKRSSACTRRPYIGHSGYLYDERGLPK